MTSNRLAAFDRLYETTPDPWGTTTRWYERRKRDLLMACLPRERFASAYEAGCGTGHITATLAERCDFVLASDASAAAVSIAARRVAAFGHVTVERHRLPEDWPPRAFDLVVLGELLYFLDDAERGEVARRARAGAATHGLVVACDWRAPIEGYGHLGEDVHRHFEDELSLPRLFEYVDDDFLLTGWSADVRTPAMREGLR